MRSSGSYADAVALLNVTGAHFIDDDMKQCPRRLYVETDPGIPQIRASNGDPAMLNLLAGHTHFCTFGENISRPDCLLPKAHIPIVRRGNRWCWTCGKRAARKWRRLHDDRALAQGQGQSHRVSRRALSLEQGSREFEAFVDLPARSGRSFELALSDIEPAEQRRLERSGWNVADAIGLSASLDAYRDYIAASAGEFTIAKDQYVRS